MKSLFFMDQFLESQNDLQNLCKFKNTVILRDGRDVMTIMLLWYFFAYFLNYFQLGKAILLSFCFLD